VIIQVLDLNSFRRTLKMNVVIPFYPHLQIAKKAIDSPPTRQLDRHMVRGAGTPVEQPGNPAAVTSENDIDIHAFATVAIVSPRSTGV